MLPSNLLLDIARYCDFEVFIIILVITLGIGRMYFLLDGWIVLANLVDFFSCIENRPLNRFRVFLLRAADISHDKIDNVSNINYFSLQNFNFN